MRINVYAEELTDDVEIVTKVIDAGTPDERTFYGVRTYFKSAPELHHTADDDDRSALTIWVPWTKALGNQPVTVATLLGRMQDAVVQTVPEGHAAVSA